MVHWRPNYFYLIDLIIPEHITPRHENPHRMDLMDLHVESFFLSPAQTQHATMSIKFSGWTSGWPRCLRLEAWLVVATNCGAFTYCLRTGACSVDSDGPGQISQIAWLHTVCCSHAVRQHLYEILAGTKQLPSKSKLPKKWRSFHNPRDWN